MAAVLTGQIVDRRATSHMAPELKLVHLRLEAWGRWSRDKLAPWPERTVLGRLIEEGPSAGEAGRGVTELPEPIAETDRAVAHLGEIDRKVIRIYYTEWQPAEYLARRCGMERRRFDSVLNRARWRIAGYLAATC